MTILLNRVWFPASDGSKVGKAFADWLKENPQDKSVIKMLSIAVSSTDDGQILIYGLDNIMNGKDKEALEYVTQQNLFMANKVADLRYKVEVILDFTEAYKLINMIAPKV